METYEKGWQCPICGQVNAPDIKACPCEQPRKKPEIIELTKTVDGCPTIWEGSLANRHQFYCRYRWGWLRVVDETVDEVLFGG